MTREKELSAEEQKLEMAQTNKTYSSIKADLDKLDEKVLSLMELSEKTCDGNVEDILTFNNEYVAITKELEKITERLLKYDKTSTTDLWDKTDSLNNDLNYIFDSAAIPINNIIATKTQELEELTRKNQGVQLAVFFIVLSILAFVLTNAKILAVNEISFKNVLLTNLSFILSADVLFSLIYLFMGPVFYSKKGHLRIFTFIILPILLIAAIVLISILVK